MDIESRLDNWRRAYISNGSYRYCGSAERGYRAPWRQYVPLNELVISVPVDVIDAEVVESAWRSLPEKPRTLIVAAYMYRAPDHITARLARVKYWMLAEEIRRAVERLDRILGATIDRHNVTVYKQP